MPIFCLTPLNVFSMVTYCQKNCPSMFTWRCSTSLTSPRHYPISLSFLQHPPSLEFLFFFSIPCHPPIILWTWQDISKPLRKWPNYAKNIPYVPKKKKDAGNPGYLSCGFYFFNFCLLCNIIGFSSWGSHMMYNKWRLYIVWAIAQSHGDGLRSSFSKDPFPPPTLPPLVTSFPPFTSSSLECELSTTFKLFFSSKWEILQLYLQNI